MCPVTHQSNTPHSPIAPWANHCFPNIWVWSTLWECLLSDLKCWLCDQIVNVCDGSDNAIRNWYGGWNWSPGTMLTPHWHNDVRCDQDQGEEPCNVMKNLVIRMASSLYITSNQFSFIFFLLFVLCSFISQNTFTQQPAFNYFLALNILFLFALRKIGRLSWRQSCSILCRIAAGSTARCTHCHHDILDPAIQL